MQNTGNVAASEHRQLKKKVPWQLYNRFFKMLKPTQISHQLNGTVWGEECKGCRPGKPQPPSPGKLSQVPQSSLRTMLSRDGLVAQIQNL